MNKLAILSLSVLSLLLSSCKFFEKLKKYERPAIQQIAAYRNYQLSDTAGIATISWKNFLKNEPLVQLIDSALVYNFDLRRAKQNLSIAKLLLKQSEANFLPSVNGDLSIGYIKPATATIIAQQDLPGNIDFMDWRFGVTYGWEIDAWGKLKSQKKSALASYMNVENTNRLIQTELINAIAYNYYLLQTLDKKQEIIERTIENRKASIETIKALKVAGMATEVAVKQTEAQLYTAQSLLIDIKNQIEIVENSLSILLGKAPQNVSRAPLETEISTTIPKLGIPIQLLSNRPDILASEYNLISAFEQTNVARASFYPSLTIGGGIGLNSRNIADLFSLRALFANIAGGLTQPIFNRKSLLIQKDVRLAQQNIALLNYQENVLTAYNEVANELSNLKASIDKLETKKQELNALSQSLLFSQELQKQGFLNNLELLRAQDAILSSEITIADIYLKYYASILNIYKALGGGWK